MENKPKLKTGLWFAAEIAPNANFAFEAYGHAMSCASALELKLCLVILKAEALKLGRRKESRRTQEELKAFAEAVRKKPIGGLITALRKAFYLSPTLIEALENAKHGRDYLAHNFWQANLGNLFDENGIDLIANQCALDAWHFRNTANLIAEELKVDVFDFVDQTIASARSKRTEWWAMVNQHI